MNPRQFDKTLAGLKKQFEHYIRPELRKREFARSKSQARRFKKMKALKRFRKRQRNESMRPPKRHNGAPGWVWFD